MAENAPRSLENHLRPLTVTSNVLFNSSSTGSVTLKINVWDQCFFFSGKKVKMFTNNRSPTADQLLKSSILLSVLLELADKIGNHVPLDYLMVEKKSKQ